MAMVLGSIALSLLASIGAAVTVGLRRGGLLVSILVLPLYVPVLIFGLSASQPNCRPRPRHGLAADPGRHRPGQPRRFSPCLGCGTEVLSEVIEPY